MKDYYRILEIAPDASLDEIRKSFRFLALIFHPDMAKHDRQKGYFEERFKEINKAYQVLSNPSEKKKYDAQYTFQQKNLEVSPRTLHFGTLIEGERKNDTFMVDFVGTPDEFNINPGKSTSWLEVKKIESITSHKTFPLEVEIVVNAAKLSPGNKYEGTIEVNVDDKKRKVNVSFRVKSRPSSPIPQLAFRFRSGGMAHTPKELIQLCDKYWDEGKEYLYDDRHFKNWFVDLRRNDVISSLETCRQETIKDIGLEKFLQSLKSSLESPKASLNVANTHLGNYDFSSRDLPKPVVQITNHGRGCCYGKLEVKNGKWLSVPKRVIAIPPGVVGDIPLQVNSDQLIWESNHTAKVSISTNSQNVKTDILEFTLTTPRYPKLVEIESLRDDGKWRLALYELQSIRNEREVNKIADQLEGTILKKKTNFISIITIVTSILYGMLGLIIGGFIGDSNAYGSDFWSDYFYQIAVPSLGFGAIGAIIGPIGAYIYTTNEGGKNGKWADYISGTLATLGFLLAIALAIGIIYALAIGIINIVKQVVMVIIVIIIFFAILGGG